MSAYEMLSIGIAIVACIISFIVWLSQRKLQQEANELQKTTSELARKQLEMLAKEELNSKKSFLSLELIPTNNKLHKFRITNISGVDAIDIEMELKLDNPADNPISSREYEEKFPYKKLSPGQSVTLIAALDFGSPSAFNALLKWTNPDGTKVEDERYVAL